MNSILNTLHSHRGYLQQIAKLEVRKHSEFVIIESECRDGSVKKGHCLKERQKFAVAKPYHHPVKKNLGEQSWKLAIFVRYSKLLITKVSAGKWPRVP